MVESSATFTVETFTASDGYRWHYRGYLGTATLPLSLPRAHVVCLHGIQSHADWYGYSCHRLSQAGFAVSFLDRRGSGLNSQDRGDAPSYGRLLDDVAEFLHYLRRTPGDSRIPVFLVGISWGGKLATAVQRWQPGLVDGLALLCPGFFPRVRLTRGELWRIGWARLVAPRRYFPIPLNNPELFTATPQWQRFIREDPLSLHQATARFLVESARLDRYLRSAPAHIQVPVLLMLAEQDRIIDNASTRRYVKEFATGDKDIIEYAGAHHTLEFESDRERFSGDLQNWLERHCPPNHLLP